MGSIDEEVGGPFRDPFSAPIHPPGGYFRNIKMGRVFKGGIRTWLSA